MIANYETVSEELPPTGTVISAVAPHRARTILTEIEDILRDLDAIPAHIAAVVKAKLAEAKSKL